MSAATTQDRKRERAGEWTGKLLRDLAKTQATMTVWGTMHGDGVKPSPRVVAAARQWNTALEEFVTALCVANPGLRLLGPEDEDYAAAARAELGHYVLQLDEGRPDRCVVAGLDVRLSRGTFRVLYRLAQSADKYVSAQTVCAAMDAPDWSVDCATRMICRLRAALEAAAPGLDGKQFITTHARSGYRLALTRDRIHITPKLDQGEGHDHEGN